MARAISASDGLGFALALARATVEAQRRSARRVALARATTGRVRAVESIAN